MPKMLSSLPSAWSKCLPVMYQRYYSTENKGIWSEAPLSNVRKMPHTEGKCHPKAGNCSTNLSVCPNTNWPKCSEPDIKPPSPLSCCCSPRLTDSVCEKTRKKILSKEEKAPFKSMWEKGDIEQKCPDINERMDETNYKSSDKTERIYTQTWKSCEPIIRRRRVCCINDICMLPPIEKRRKHECPQTAKEQDSEQLKVDIGILKECMDNITKTQTQNNANRKNKCKKIVMPCCRKVAKKIKCHHNRQHSDCLKDCCPHPSFSECDHSDLTLGPPVECRCTHFEHQCIANRYLVRKKFFNLPPALPSWPPKERPK